MRFFLIVHAAGTTYGIYDARKKFQIEIDLNNLIILKRILTESFTSDNTDGISAMI